MDAEKPSGAKGLFSDEEGAITISPKDLQRLRIRPDMILRILLHFSSFSDIFLEWLLREGENRWYLWYQEAKVWNL